MKLHRYWAAILVSVACVSWVATAQRSVVSVCDYDPPESHVLGLTIQGSFNWYDGPYLDDRSRTVAGTLLADFSRLDISSQFGQQIDARGEVRGTNVGWTANLDTTGSLTLPLQNDLFGVAAVGVRADTTQSVELDLTGGVGSGAFRDVTPMANAIRIQNSLLDLGQLLAPLPSDTLLKLAQILGEVGPSDDDKLASTVNLLVSTQLVPDSELSVRGLLVVRSILESNDAARLCGSDVQARIGASAVFAPAITVSATGLLLARYAAVPNPVTQWNADAQLRFRIAQPEQMSVEGNITYLREFPDGWTARAEYRATYDHFWSMREDISLSHDASASLTTKVFGTIGLSLVGDLRYRTGDEEWTISLAVHLEADLL
jgi:hypothetical protein